MKKVTIREESIRWPFPNCNMNVLVQICILIRKCSTKFDQFLFQSVSDPKQHHNLE